MKTKSNRFWLILLGGVLLVCVLLAVYLSTRSAPGDTAIVTLEGNQVAQVDLSRVKESYTVTYKGSGGLTNTVEFAPGKVRVLEATCPDQICVYQGWIEADVFPIACLPNGLIIQVVSAEDMAELDGQVR